MFNLVAALLISLSPTPYTPPDPFLPPGITGNPPINTPCIFLPGPYTWLCPQGVVPPPLP